MEAKIILLSLMLFFACSSKENSEKQKTSQFNKNYYKFVSNGSQYHVEWGNGLFKNVSGESFDISSGEFGLVNSGKDAIVLSKGCGTSCRYFLILPMKKATSEKSYLFAIAYNETRNLIAYIPETTDEFIKIEDFMTGKSMAIKESQLCSAAFKGDCIDKCYFDSEGNSLYIEWQGNKWSNKKTDKRKTKINVKL